MLEAVHLRARGQAQRRAEDDAQRDSPHYGERETPRRAARRTAVERLQPHGVEERPHSLAFKGGTRTRRCPRVRCPVEHQDRVPPDGRGKNRVGLARVEHVRVAAEDLADGLRVGQHHEPAVAGDVEREGVTVTAVALVEQSERVAREPDELPPCRATLALQEGRAQGTRR